MNKLVSIITPAYNCQKYIEETIRSVRNQTYPYWEHIIVDDASSDQTPDLIYRYAKEDSRIRFVQLEENRGVAHARNTALELVSGDYVAFLDSDDQWKPEKLEKHLKFMLKNKISFSYTPYDVIDENGNYIRKIIPRRNKVSYQQLLLTNIMACCTIIIESTLIKNERMPAIGHEDYAMWLNILQHNKINAVCFEECLSIYRKTANSISANKWKTICWNYQIYRNNQNLGSLKSMYYLMNFIARTSMKYINKNNRGVCHENCIYRHFHNSRNGRKQCTCNENVRSFKGSTR